MIEVLSFFIFFVLMISFLLNFVNFFFLDKVNEVNNDKSDNFISVLIPARNEEDNIKTCVLSVINQNYSGFELLILNDGSTDRTGEILNELKLKDSRVKILNGMKLPDGWVGKNYACHQLQKEANGKYLLFIDADTELNSDCLGRVMNFSILKNSDLLSVMPYEITGSFWEKVTIPMLYFAVMAFIPLAFIERSRSNKFAMGNGQFMFFKRSFYDKIGGHESLKNRIVEDVWLSKRVKEFGGKLVFADGTDLSKCRMYRNFNEVWNGFSKNFFAGLSFSITGLILLNLFYFVIFILPPFLFVYGLAVSNLFVLYCSVISFFIPVFIRISHSVKFKQPFWFSFLNVLSSVMIILLSLNSYRIIKFGKGAIWKDRNYKESTIN